VPPSSFVTGSDAINDNLILGYAHIDLAVPGAPVLLSHIGNMIFAHSAREAAVLEGEGGLKRGKKAIGKASHRGC
jgi:hypothetical protein